MGGAKQMDRESWAALSEFGLAARGLAVSSFACGLKEDC